MNIHDIYGGLLYESAHTTMRETVEDAVKHGVNLSGADLLQAALSALSGSDLRGAKMGYSEMSVEFRSLFSRMTILRNFGF